VIKTVKGRYLFSVIFLQRCGTVENKPSNYLNETEYCSVVQLKTSSFFQ